MARRNLFLVRLQSCLFSGSYVEDILVAFTLIAAFAFAALFGAGILAATAAASSLINNQLHHSSW